MCRLLDVAPVSAELVPQQHGAANHRLFSVTRCRLLDVGWAWPWAWSRSALSAFHSFWSNGLRSMNKGHPSPVSTC